MSAKIWFLFFFLVPTQLYFKINILTNNPALLPNEMIQELLRE